MTDLVAAQKRLALLKQKERLKRELPHLYGFNWYDWAWEVFHSRNRKIVLCAGNQLSKSSTIIRKVIHWATATELWPELWPNRTPRMFWYLYPDKKSATQEFRTKWVPEFLPSGEMKDDPKYGWKEEWEGKFISAIHFNSGISLYFKTYKQDVHSLQAGSVDFLACDEELPFELWGELSMRCAATNGYFAFAFTATRGQEEWRKIVEGDSWPDALKFQISAYDCQRYRDGTPSHWTNERIEQSKALLGTQREIDKRIYGRFVIAEGLVYESFERHRHFKKGHPVPASWSLYAGIDYGSGTSAEGGQGHPSAISIVAVSPDFKQGRLIKFWRGDGQRTTCEDVIKQYLKMSAGLNVCQAFYDWAAADLETFAINNGLALTKADKNHEVGEGTLNTLFKSDQFIIYDDGSGEPEKVVLELEVLTVGLPKRHAKDDGIDSLRYAVSKIPWVIDIKLPDDLQPVVATEITSKKHRTPIYQEESWDDYEAEISEWNELYDEY